MGYETTPTNMERTLENPLLARLGIHRENFDEDQRGLDQSRSGDIICRGNSNEFERHRRITSGDIISRENFDELEGPSTNHVWRYP